MKLWSPYWMLVGFQLDCPMTSVMELTGLSPVFLGGYFSS